MCLKAIAKGESVIKQGDVGDFFYIVKSGDFDIIVKKGGDPAKKVFEAGVGFAFGELALLYNAPRSATITASAPSEVWALDRTAFRNLVVLSAETQFRARVDFLNGVDVFQVLDERERASLAEVLEEEEFEDDEAIVEQDEKDDKMFILQTGKAVACIRGEQGEVEVMQYSAGDYFGEIALLSGEPRKASVYAVGHATCLYITRPTFLRVLGPLKSLLERNISRYEKYQDALAHVEHAEHAEHPDDEHESPAHSPRRDSPHQDHHDNEEEFTSGGALRKTKVVNRKRQRKVAEDISVLDNHKKVDHELPSETPPETLADKVAQDFKNPTLVSPAKEFEVRGLMQAFGGMLANQKFTQDKAMHVRSEAASLTKKGEEETYEWQGQTKLKQATEISVICQKGQKSASDPTPNQDNFFVHHVGSATVYGVADGHGPFGHLVSFRIVQTLPHFIAKSEHAGKDWELTLKDAFLKSQSDLVAFCEAQGINIEASGAAASVVLLEEQTVHIAHIGDSRVMLGSWNRRDSRLIFCTKDHKPEMPAERARLEAAGSEVREIDPGNFRIYLSGSNFPGLTMSRAFGDRACGGVLQEPEYHKELMQPNDQFYCILASDGIWEFMEGEEVCTMTAKKLRLKGPRETLHHLVSASRKRWGYCCGDYCDDITAILVQWNASSENKDSRRNHTMTLTRPAAAG
uniref:cGMP-dependent protein kinase n=1 Tax=Alexandrium catenella TaxID=2925 RepID=A0A7S1WMR6_ALECA